MKIERDHVRRCVNYRIRARLNSCRPAEIHKQSIEFLGFALFSSLFVRFHGTFVNWGHRMSAECRSICHSPNCAATAIAITSFNFGRLYRDDKLEAAAVRQPSVIKCRRRYATECSIYKVKQNIPWGNTCRRFGTAVWRTDVRRFRTARPIALRRTCNDTDQVRCSRTYRRACTARVCRSNSNLWMSKWRGRWQNGLYTFF